jgi:transcription elongation factor/antiterminator RfaH
MEVYLPRIRFRRSTRGGPVWFTEALFPNYLFVRFDLRAALRRVHYTSGVSGVIRFGDHWPEIPDAVIEDLRCAVGPDAVHEVGEELEPGDPVVISGGAFHDLRAVVTRVMTGRERVAVLLEILGRQTAVELPASEVVPEGGIYGGLK